MPNGSVVLRRIVTTEEDSGLVAVAAGVACRLMQAPACRHLEAEADMDTTNVLKIVVATTSSPVGIGTGGGGDLAPGDVWVQRLGSNDASSSTSDSSS